MTPQAEKSAENLVEERVQQLQEISRRRNELLREMYHLIQKRDNLGSVIAIEEDVEDDLQTFLDRFDLQRHPESGQIGTLLEDEVALPETPPAYSPVGGMERELTPEIQAKPEPEVHAVSDSPISEPPASPPTVKHEEQAELLYPETSQTDIPMDVDQSVLPAPPHAEEEDAHSEDEEIVESMTSPEPSEGLQTAPQSPDAGQEETVPADPAKSPTPLERLSPSPQISSIRPSPARQYPSIARVATREPSAPRASAPPEERFQTPLSPPARAREGVVKAEPLEDEVMYDTTVEPTEPPPPPPQDEPRGRPGVSDTFQIVKEASEDQIMDILGPSQARSSAPADDYRHSAVEYSIPLPAIGQDATFAFEEGVGEFVEAAPPAAPYGPDPPYPLPPANLLPIEFSRRKTSKRKRDKEKGEVREWQPMLLNKWSALMKANGVHAKLSKAAKILSTRDWTVGITELRLIRVFERIEKLKESNQWSFRQPKKQRGLGGLAKTHWDYVMDEMRWMRTDFREERKWKLVLAHTLAHAVVEWHEAGTLEERLRRGIVVLWKPPPLEDTEMADASEGEHADGPFQDTDENGVDSRETGTPNDGYASDDESDDEQEKEPPEGVDVLEPGTALQEALQQLEDQAATTNAPTGGQTGVPVKPKLEEIEDLTALGSHASSQDQNAMDVDESKAEKKGASRSAGATGFNASPSQLQGGLKPSSKNPILAGPSKEGDPGHGKAKHKVSQYAALREHIIYSDVDKLFVDLDDIDLVKSMSELSTDDPLAASAPPPVPHDLSEIFPDLQPYGMFDVAPPMEGRKKGERRSDKDDPNKRAEDTTYTKLVPMSKYMTIKPAVVNVLKPAIYFKDDHWLPIEPTPVFADVEVPSARPLDDNLCALFEGKPNPPAGHSSLMNLPARDVRKRNTDHHNDSIAWTPAEDNLLKQVAERYPYNWNLIADVFNSSRVTISTDKRTAWECLDRWREKFSAQARADTEDNTPSTSASASASHMTTRGYKRTATQALASGSGSGNANSSEPRKKRRHTTMHDILRKAAKRREAVQKSSAAPRAKPSVVHDTHGQFTKMPRLTPAELSRMKAEKEHQAREQQRAQGAPLSGQQPQPQQQLLSAHGSPNGVGRPANPAQMQQLRAAQVGISQQQQQQRIAAALAANASTRMSPPQLAQAAHFRAVSQGQPQPQAGAQVQAPAQAQTQVSTQAQASHVPSAAAALAAAAPALSAAHLSPSFAARTASSSPGAPHQSPPLPAASPANASAVARPPSVPGQPVQMNPMMQMTNMAAAQYYLMHGMQGGRMTPEQITAILQQQMRQHQQQQPQQYASHAQQAQPQNPPNANFPQS